MERLKITLTTADYRQCVALCLRGHSHASTINRAQVLLAYFSRYLAVSA
ncbi:hypothetical protein [Pseudanabaena sp. UWO310]|nr:hypothetical protein [Pseudanabaena sp. UWO310]